MAVKVLLVDDEPGLRTTLAANLELDGLEVVEVESAERALEVLKDGDFDVVLTDIRMPGMSGVELLHSMKKTHGHIPVVLATAFALEETVQGALRCGAFAMLPKPTRVADVVATITRAARRPFVLVLDPVVTTSEALVAILTAAGVRACSANDGKAAVELVTRGQVDVCVASLGPRGDQVIAELQRMAPDVAIIAIAASISPGLADLAMQGRAFACLRAPVQSGDLVQVVAEARGRARRGVSRT
jgi:DNA-binding NtrC family response regulator